MLKKRLIPCLIAREGMLVKSMEFKRYQIVGNPKTTVQYFNAWAVDEIILLNITPNREFNLGRRDKNDERVGSFLEIIRDVSQYCFLPLTVGGGIASVDAMRLILGSGADKIVINTAAFRNSRLITAGANAFGSQCIVVSIDAKKIAVDFWEVFINGGKESTGCDVVVWAKKAQELGAGEIFLTSIDKDGTLSGYDIDLLRAVSSAVTIPVIACGGVGKWEHFVEGVFEGGASAVSAANIFHFTEQSTKKAKIFMRNAGINVRDDGTHIDTRSIRRS